MRRILVTAISGNVGNGVLKALQDTEDELYGCDINQYAAGMDKVKNFFVVPPAVDAAYIPTMLKLCGEYYISYLIPTNEAEIEAIAAQRGQFEAAGINLVLQNDEILRICLDKYLCMKFLSSNGICVPPSWLAAKRNPEKDVRRIIKPRKSCGSKSIRIIEANEDLTQAEMNEQNLVQVYVPGRENEYTVGIFSDGESTSAIAFRRKLRDGYSDFVELVKNAEIEEIAQKISKIFDLHGYINVQMREYQGKYYIFEINPRISGAVYYQHMLGFCDVLWWLQMLDGQSIKQYQCPYKKAIGLRELKEKFVELE